MRSIFDKSFKKLDKKVMELGAHVIQSLEDTSVYLETQQPSLLEAIQTRYKSMQRQANALEQLCHKMIMKQQPVAQDLVYITECMKIIDKLAMIGRQTVNIVEYSAEVSTMMFPPLNHMMTYSSQCVVKAIEAFGERNILLAQIVIENDKQIDESFEHMRQETLHDEVDALTLLMMAKSLERIGDGAAAISYAVCKIDDYTI